MNKIVFAINRQQKAMSGSNIFFLDVAYKPDIIDTRESPALLVMEQVAHKGATVLYHDPYIPEVLDDHGHKWVGVELTDKLLAKINFVVFTTNHASFEANRHRREAKRVIDMRKALKRVHIDDKKSFKL